MAHVAAGWRWTLALQLRRAALAFVRTASGGAWRGVGCRASGGWSCGVAQEHDEEVLGLPFGAKQMANATKGNL